MPVSPPPNKPPKRVRWVGPRDAPPLAACYHLVAESASLVDAEADLTIYACPRPLGDTKRLSEIAAEGDTVQLLGVWCEGEGRTGQTVPAVPRIFWHAWPAWWRQHLLGGLVDEAPAAGSVWIQTGDAELAAALVAALSEARRPAVWAPAERLLVGAPSAILWDGSQLGGREADQLAATCHPARSLGAPVVALLDFPRPETVAAAESIGAAAVVGKPFDRELLLSTIASVASSSHEASNEPIAMIRHPSDVPVARAA